MAFTVNQYIEKSCNVVAGKTTHTLTYTVVTDDVAADGFDAAAAVGFDIGDQYGASGCYLRSVDSDNSNSEDGYTYRVTFTFDNAFTPGEGSNEGEGPDPVTEPWEREWDAQYEEQIIDEDARGKNILNLVGDPYRDPVTRERPIAVLSVTGNMRGYNEGLAAAYRGKCNSDTYMGWSPGDVKCLAVKASLQYDEYWGNYWRVTYQLGFNSLGWDRRIQEVGYNEITNNNGTDTKSKIMIDDEEGNRVYPTDPVLLGRDKKALPAGDYPVYTYYQIYERLPFNGVFY